MAVKSLRQATSEVLVKIAGPFMGKGIVAKRFAALNSLYWILVRMVSNDIVIRVGANQLRAPNDGSIVTSYEFNVQNLLRHFLRRGMIAVDVGAHVGFYTLLMAESVGPDGVVYAIEPDPRNWTYLQRNIRENNLKNIRCFRVALSSHSGEGVLYQAQHSASSSLQRTYYLSSQGNQIIEEHTTTPVEIKTLKDILGDKIKVDLIKIDIEAAEIDALKGMAEIIEANRGILLILEFHPSAIEQFGHDPHEFWELLWGYGFTIWLIGKNLRIIPRPNGVNRHCNVVCSRDDSLIRPFV
jgi:FkbM family methyltransferase